MILLNNLCSLMFELIDLETIPVINLFSFNFTPIFIDCVFKSFSRFVNSTSQLLVSTLLINFQLQICNFTMIPTLINDFESHYDFNFLNFHKFS